MKNDLIKFYKFIQNGLSDNIRLQEVPLLLLQLDTSVATTDVCQFVIVLRLLVDNDKPNTITILFI